MQKYMDLLFLKKILSILPLCRLRGESSTPLEVITTVVPVLKDTSLIPACNMINRSPASEDFEDEETEIIDTEVDPRIINHSSVQGELQSLVQGKPSSS